jgi:hypothetical protein
MLSQGTGFFFAGSVDLWLNRCQSLGNAFSLSIPLRVYPRLTLALSSHIVLLATESDSGVHGGIVDSIEAGGSSYAPAAKWVVWAERLAGVGRNCEWLRATKTTCDGEALWFRFYL